MRFRTGLLVGLAVGYYYGAKAGRARFEQIDAWLERVRGTTTYQDLRIKLSDGWREGTTAARRALDDSTSPPTRSTTSFGDGPDLRARFSDPTLN